MVLSELAPGLLIAGVAGGMIGAAIGGLQALGLAGVVVTVGEIANVTGGATLISGTSTELDVFGVPAAALDAIGVSAGIGFGPVLGPHVAFAGGVAAAAYVGRRETIDTGFRYHQAKKITKPLGSAPDVLLVGGAFGALGVAIARVSSGAGLPVDPVFLAIVVSAFVHRLAFGYPIIGRVRDLPNSVLDMSPFERDERWGEPDHETAQGTGGRHVAEPWLPEHYHWQQVAVLGAGVGVASGYLALATGSHFLAFGVTAASLLFLSAGLYSLPVTHHMALPAGITAIAASHGEGIASSGVGIAESEPILALAIAGVFGTVAALAGELAQRVLYAHGDTHLDPPAVSIVLTSLLLVVLGAVGILEPELIPYPEL